MGHYVRLLVLRATGHFSRLGQSRGFTGPVASVGAGARAADVQERGDPAGPAAGPELPSW